MPGRSYIADDNNYVTNSALKNAHRFGFNAARVKRRWQPSKMRNYYNIATNNHGLSVNHGAGSRTRRPYSSGELEQIERSLDEAIENEKN